jgi:hypothetical protein
MTIQHMILTVMIVKQIDHTEAHASEIETMMSQPIILPSRSVHAPIVSTNTSKIKKQIPWRTSEGVKCMLCLANAVFFEKGHTSSHGDTAATWKRICTSFSNDKLMIDMEMVQEQTLMKKFKSMLNDTSLMYHPTTDELGNYEDTGDDELSLKCKLHEIREEIEEHKLALLKSKNDKNEKEMHRLKLSTISCDVIAKSTNVRPRSHGLLTTPDNVNKETNEFKTPSSSSIDQLLVTLLGNRKIGSSNNSDDLSNVSKNTNTSNNNVKYVEKYYENKSNTLLVDCKFLSTDCGIPESEASKIDVGYLTVGIIVEVYKTSYSSISEFHTKGKEILELPARVLSRIYMHLKQLHE